MNEKSSGEMITKKGKVLSLNVSEKLRIGETMVLEDKSPGIVGKALNLNVNTMKKYKRMAKQGVLMHKTCGKPRLIDDEADEAVRQFCLRNKLTSLKQLSCCIDE